MSIGKNLLKGSAVLGGSEFLKQGCSFVRNLILARLLSKEDFGIAATLSLVISMLELAGKTSLGQLIAQSRHGEDVSFLSSVQFLQALLGLCGSLLILLLSHPLSVYFRAIQYQWAIKLLAFVPLSIGLSSLDVYRRVRHLQFLPLATQECTPEIITTLAAWPLAVALGDYRAILYLMLGRALLLMITSHFLSQKAFSVRPKINYIKESLFFSGPLLLSGFIFFANFQGDRFLVAGAYSLADLGSYAIASTISMMPGLSMLKLTGTIGLPMLAKSQDRQKEFLKRYSGFLQLLTLISTLFVGAMILIGGQVIIMLFGAKYAGIGTLAAWLSAAQAARIIRGAPTLASMALGDALNMLHSNLVRLSGLFLGAFAVYLGKSLCWIAAAAFIGEVAALIASAVLLKSKLAETWRLIIHPVALFLLINILILFMSIFVGEPLLTRWILFLMSMGTIVFVYLWSFKTLRESMMSVLTECRTKISLLAWPKAS